MVEVNVCNMQNIASFFDGWNETLIWSCLQGHMGRAFADNADNPRAAQIITGDFCFFAGDAEAPGSRELVQNIPADYNRPWILMIPKEESWNGYM